MATRTAAKGAAASKGGKATASKATASKATRSGASTSAATTFNRRSLTVGVGSGATLASITKLIEKKFKESGCPRCFSGLDKLILDSKVNPQ
ncbi:MAG TPA: hypothetical protein VF659_20485 [Pyrinomonadaceae bacterium]|jgi:ribose 5-phosphate isomerase